MGVVFLDDALQLIFNDVPAGWEPGPAAFFLPGPVIGVVGVEGETVQLLQIGLLEGVELGFLEEGGHGKVHFSIDDGTGVEDELIGWMIVLNKNI